MERSYRGPSFVLLFLFLAGRGALSIPPWGNQPSLTSRGGRIHQMFSVAKIKKKRKEPLQRTTEDNSERQQSHTRSRRDSSSMTSRSPALPRAETPFPKALPPPEDFHLCLMGQDWATYSLLSQALHGERSVSVTPTRPDIPHTPEHPKETSAQSQQRYTWA